MNPDRFEQRLADWLEEGPEVATPGVVETALAHAAGHPRSRSRALALRVRRHGAALAAAALVVVLGGGTLIVGSRFRPSVTPVASVAVSGTESCVGRVAGAVLVPQAGSGQSDELRGRIDDCRQVASDPRVSGILTRRVDAWLFSPDQTTPAGSSSDFGTIELRNEAGTWTGAFVATYLSRTDLIDGRMSWIALGSGEYAGLAYRATVVTDRAGEAKLTGTIEPVASDAVIASTWCWIDRATPDLSAGSVSHRAAERSCLVTSDDERLAGTAKEYRVIDTASDGTTRDTGTLIVTAARGGWTGAFAGTGDWYVPGEVAGTLDGRSELEGQRLSFRIVSEDGMHGVLVGIWLTPAP